MTQETTRDLLELAAKAARHRVVDRSAPITLYIASEGCKGGESWNPAYDDGDCARLEAALSIDVSWECGFVTAKPINGIHGLSEGYSDHDEDRQAARRMATLKAAAEIGRMVV